VWVLGSSPGPGAPALQGGSFLVREPAPDPVLLVRLHGELQARLDHGAALANSLGARLSGLLLELRLALLAEEQDVVVGTTDGAVLPVQFFGGIR
jgi:hypothetical protein